MKKYGYSILSLVSAAILLGFLTFMLPQGVSASASTADTETTLTAPSSNIETVPNDPIPIEEAPSTRQQNQTNAMEAFFIFAISWTIIYSIIKMFRRKRNDRMMK